MKIKFGVEMCFILIHSVTTQQSLKIGLFIFTQNIISYCLLWFLGVKIIWTCFVSFNNYHHTDVGLINRYFILFSHAIYPFFSPLTKNLETQGKRSYDEILYTKILPTVSHTVAEKWLFCSPDHIFGKIILISAFEPSNN